jgi:hypothetical protein
MGNLFYVEGITLSTLIDPLGQGRRHFLSPQVCQELPHFSTGQTIQANAMTRRMAVQVPQNLGQGVILRQTNVMVDANDQQRHR